MAKPNYGGWVSFTAHLAKMTNGFLFKVGTKLEKSGRPFGYGLAYRNIPAEIINKLPNPIITAIDKNYYGHLKQVNNAKIILHDPTELKPELIKIIKSNNIRVYGDRDGVVNVLNKKFDIKANKILHPYIPFDLKAVKKSGMVSISRIDFDKNIDILLDSGLDIDIYGACNTMYVYHKLDRERFDYLYRGKYPKKYDAVRDILGNKRFLVDMSTIKDDGGGTQYTFLEGINAECVLVLNKKWAEAGNTFKHNYNCLLVENAKQLSLINQEDDYSHIIKNAKKIINKHSNIKIIEGLI